MTDLTPVPPRDALRARIEAAERRNAERSPAAIAPPITVSGLARV